MDKCPGNMEEKDAKPGKAKLDACPLNKTKDCLRPFLYSVPVPALSNQGKNKHEAKTPGGGKNPGDYPLHHIFG